MKKILSIIVTIISVLSLVACGGNKGEKLTLYAETWEGDDVRLAADFYYPEDAGITLEGDEEYPNWMDMHYESKNITISPALFEDTTFDANKNMPKRKKKHTQNSRLTVMTVTHMRILADTGFMCI